MIISFFYFKTQYLVLSFQRNYFPVFLYFLACFCGLELARLLLRLLKLRTCLNILFLVAGGCRTVCFCTAVATRPRRTRTSALRRAIWTRCVWTWCRTRASTMCSSCLTSTAIFCRICALAWSEVSAWPPRETSAPRFGCFLDWILFGTELL